MKYASNFQCLREDNIVAPQMLFTLSHLKKFWVAFKFGCKQGFSSIFHCQTPWYDRSVDNSMCEYMDTLGLEHFLQPKKIHVFETLLHCIQFQVRRLDKTNCRKTMCKCSDLFLCVCRDLCDSFLIVTLCAVTDIIVSWKTCRSTKGTISLWTFTTAVLFLD